MRSHITWPLILALVWTLGCNGGGGYTADDDTEGDDDVGDDDTGDDDTGDDDDSTQPEPDWTCADGLSVHVSPVPTSVVDVLHLDPTGDQGYVHVGMSGTGPGGESVNAEFDGVVDQSGSGTGPWT